MKRVFLFVTVAGAISLLTSCGTVKRVIGIPLRAIGTGVRSVTENTPPPARPESPAAGTTALATRIYGP